MKLFYYKPYNDYIDLRYIHHEHPTQPYFTILNQDIRELRQLWGHPRGLLVRCAEGRRDLHRRPRERSRDAYSGFAAAAPVRWGWGWGWGRVVDFRWIQMVSFWTAQKKTKKMDMIRSWISPNSIITMEMHGKHSEFVLCSGVDHSRSVSLVMESRPTGVLWNYETKFNNCVKGGWPHFGNGNWVSRHWTSPVTARCTFHSHLSCQDLEI